MLLLLGQNWTPKNVSDDCKVVLIFRLFFFVIKFDILELVLCVVVSCWIMMIFNLCLMKFCWYCVLLVFSFVFLVLTILLLFPTGLWWYCVLLDYILEFFWFLLLVLCCWFKGWCLLLVLCVQAPVMSICWTSKFWKIYFNYLVE